EGQWANVPLGGDGAARDNGSLTLGGTFGLDPFAGSFHGDPGVSVGRWNVLDTRFTNNGVFGGSRWKKLYDVVARDAAGPYDDAYEENDTQATATDLGTLNGGSTTRSDLQARDDDWFRFQTASSGTISARIDFVHARGDLDLELYDASGTRIGL